MTPIHLIDGAKFFVGYANMLLWLAFMDVKGMMNWISFFKETITDIISSKDVFGWISSGRKLVHLPVCCQSACQWRRRVRSSWLTCIIFHRFSSVDVTCLNHLTFVGWPRYLVLDLGRTAGLLYDPDQRCCSLHLQILWWNLRLWERHRCRSPGSKTANPQKAWFHLAFHRSCHVPMERKHQPKFEISTDKNDAVCSFYV